MAGYITLNYWDLGIASLLVLSDAGLSIAFGLGLHRTLLIAGVRMAVQLTLVGLVLTALFAVVSPLWTGVAVRHDPRQLCVIRFATERGHVRGDTDRSGTQPHAPLPTRGA